MSCAYFSKLAHVVLNKNWKERARAAAWRPKEEPLVRWKLSLYRKEQENMHKRNKNQTSHATGAGIATGTQIEVRFALERADANQVYLCGDFNERSATNLPMIRREAGRWEKRVTLPPGRYEYKFIVDGPPIPPGRKRLSTPLAPLIRWWRFMDARRPSTAPL